MTSGDEGSDGLLYLEDLSVGRRFVSGVHEIDAGQIKAFAAQFDPQPFHLDDAAAENSLFGGLAASGWHTGAISMKLIVASTPLAGGVIGGGGEIAWPLPVRPGDRLQVESEIIAIKPSRTRPRGVVTMRSETRNQRGEIVQAATMKVIVQRRPASS